MTIIAQTKRYFQKPTFILLTNMRNKDKGVVKRFIVTPDKHFPLHSQPAIDCLIKAIHIVKP